MPSSVISDYTDFNVLYPGIAARVYATRLKHLHPYRVVAECMKVSDSSVAKLIKAGEFPDNHYYVGSEALAKAWYIRAIEYLDRYENADIDKTNIVERYYKRTPSDLNKVITKNKTEEVTQTLDAVNTTDECKATVSTSIPEVDMEDKPFPKANKEYDRDMLEWLFKEFLDILYNKKEEK